MIKNNINVKANGQAKAIPANRLNNDTNTETMPSSKIRAYKINPKNEKGKENKITNDKKKCDLDSPQSIQKAWERELIGNFLLKMTDKQVLSAQNDWYVDKRCIRLEFEQHLRLEPNGASLRTKLSPNGSYNIGSLLQRSNFLINTPRGDRNYHIKSMALMDFRREKYNILDEEHRQSELSIVSVTSDSTSNGSIIENCVLDDSAKLEPLKYQKTQKSKLLDFDLSSMGCYICQCNFESIEKYEEHIEYHGDESDFESLKKMTKHKKPMLKLSYKTCVDSHYFGFTLETQLKDVTIEKFIIVQSRQFYYVYNNRLPLKVPDSGELVFFVDSHVFMILREQPIVIGFSQQVNGQRIHYVEQHHFMRTEALPKVNFNLNPYRLSNSKTFQGGRLQPAPPPKAVVTALKRDAYEAQLQLVEYNKDYRNFCELGNKLTQSNFYGTLSTLLQVEDIERLQCYVALRQSKMELHQFGKELSVNLQPNSRNLNAEDVLSPGDDVLIINERCTINGQSGKSKSGVCEMLENNNLVLELALEDFNALIQWGHKINDQFGPTDKERREPRVYFAHVLGVSTQRVNITCDRHLPDNTTYTLIFRPVRAVLRYQYRALHQLMLLNSDHVQRLLFPKTQNVETRNNEDIRFFNGSIERNPEQKQAVLQITLNNKLPAPYILFGPPGTGKTATICEAICQLYVRRPETHILVLAGSNTACDEIALRLLRLISNMPSQARPLTRIFAASCDRRIDNIDDLLLEYSNMYALHFYPDVQAVHEYRIVICTLSLAGKLSTGGFGRDTAKRNVFSHVFVDEAGAITEAEVLMGITCTISPSTNLILSGDHKQLGPVLQSQRAGDWGFGVSMLERLLQCECYHVDKNGHYNEAVQTRLLRNYRSHPKIVSLYNDLYYDGKLIPKAPMSDVSLCKNWFHAPNGDFPILFHSVFGTTMNTKSSISICNNKEIDAVMDYVKDLMYFGINGNKISQTDIGIISPYKSQHQRIQEQLNMRNWNQISCGSVELFQGKEKQIIIVSFVRSFTHNLGFLNNSRRLNVLLSRPMSMLILIGNPRTLSKNNEFRYIIELCRERKTLVGSPYYLDDNKTNEANGGKSERNDINATNKSKHPSAEGTENVKSLGETFRRTNEQISSATQDDFNGGIRTKTKNTECDLKAVFDELPPVPRLVEDSDIVRSIRTDMERHRIYNNNNKTCTQQIIKRQEEPQIFVHHPLQSNYAIREYAPTAPPLTPIMDRRQVNHSYQRHTEDRANNQSSNKKKECIIL